jgi:hypothetical protein
MKTLPLLLLKIYIRDNGNWLSHVSDVACNPRGSYAASRGLQQWMVGVLVWGELAGNFFSPFPPEWLRDQIQLVSGTFPEV